MQQHHRQVQYQTSLPDGIQQVADLLEVRLANRAKLAHAELRPWRLIDDDSCFSVVIREAKFTAPEQMIVLLSLLPELAPDTIGDLIRKYAGKDREDTAIGGVRGKQHRGVLPTGEMAQFLIGASNPAMRFAAGNLLSPNGKLLSQRYLKLLPSPDGEPYLAGILQPSMDFRERIFTGKVSHPTFSPDFPAQLLETDLQWDDLVLPERSLQEIAYLKNYLHHHDQLAGDPAFGRHSRRGYRALFHGPPGTGKTLTATLLGKAVDKPVFRVDLSMVVSKWIGETEKNLSGLFDRAESKGWILFFDEADALFSKRGEVKESRDKYANQETSFLLQRVENYDGLCILASNFRQNMDKAFTRRFESIVPFTPPTPEERQLMWQKMLPDTLPVSPDVDLTALSLRYELTGANIANAVRHCVYEAIAGGEKFLSKTLLLSGIRREYEKEDRLFPSF